MRVRFLPDEVHVEIREGESILELAARAGITLRGACGGDGTCGRCLVVLREGAVQDADGVAVAGAGAVFRACRFYPVGDPVIEVPDTSRLHEHQVLTGDGEEDAAPLWAQEGVDGQLADPLLRRVTVSLVPPEPGETADDWGRLALALARETGGEVRADLAVLRELPAVLRARDWTVTADLGTAGGPEHEVVAVQPGRAAGPAYGVAVDLGTTTVAAQLVDLESGRVLGTAGTYNRQAAYGDDVISRIIFAGEHSGGRRRLQEAVVNTVNSLLAELRRLCGIERDAVRAAVCAGNPTMSHLFLGVDPAHIRLEPYTPAANFWPPCRADDLGLDLHPRAPVHVLPGVASYLGGDITGGLTASGFGAEGRTALFVDIGTNGEMVLGDGDWLIGCSCSAGPAFEGSGITCGMRAVSGAIERVGATPGGFEVVCRAIGDGPPAGVCGSGLIAALAGLRRAGVINRAGQFEPDLETPRFRSGDAGGEFVLAWARETAHGRDIVLTGADLQNLLRAKAAVYAGLRTLLAAVNLDQQDISRVYIAGGFGRFLNLREAVAIGMLPDIAPERYTFVGNSSLRGARAALLSGRLLAEIGETARRITYLELGEGTRFMEEYVSALFLPHTDVGLFPSVRERE
ncbi:MAG: ASKHA domain-containing protein [Bacillota bacterium]